eukprot:SAG11_NODE_2921_length_2835_cov_4.759868_2_plen_75_part_00
MCYWRHTQFVSARATVVIVDDEGGMGGGDRQQLRGHAEHQPSVVGTFPRSAVEEHEVIKRLQRIAAAAGLALRL